MIAKYNSDCFKEQGTLYMKAKIEKFMLMIPDKVDKDVQ